MGKLKAGVLLSLFLSLTSVYAEVSPETIVSIFQRLEALENKSRELTGENEVLKHQLSQLKKAQKQGFLNIDERMDELAKPAKPTAPKQADLKKEIKQDSADVKSEAEAKSDKVANGADSKAKAEKSKEATDKNTKPAATITSTTDKPKDPKVASKASEKTPPKKKTRAPNSYEKETYQAAFSLMKKSPSAATKAFEEYIKIQPESPLAANAQYWIGEIKYSHNNYKGAVQEFIKVLQKYKYSDKAPDAAIKLGYSFYALKNWAYARRTFDDVIKYFPNNKNAVNLAQRRLAKMTAAGH